MTDRTPDPLDDLASAHLDGATTPDEAARVQADPALQARVEAMGRVRDAVGEVAPADPDERAATIAAVLARLDEGGSVTTLPPVRGGGRTTRSWRLLAAAAAVVLVALLVPLLARDDEPDARLEATGEVLDRSTAPPGAAEDAAGEEGTAIPPTSSTLPQRPLVPDLGAHATVEDLLAAPGMPPAPSAAYGATPGDTVNELGADAPDAFCAAARPASAVVVGRATVAGRPVIVLRDTSGFLVLEDGTCVVVADRRG